MTQDDAERYRADFAAAIERTINAMRGHLPQYLENEQAVRFAFREGWEAGQSYRPICGAKLDGGDNGVCHEPPGHETDHATKPDNDGVYTAWPRTDA